LTCKFCQNWDISKSRKMDTLADSASPDEIADAAERLGCRSVAFTYNDPVIFLEYARDVAAACHDRGVRTVAVTAGYVNAEPREEFFSFIDAANIDLKAFDEDFYRRVAGAHLEPVLNTLRYLRHETDLWFEITASLLGVPPELQDARRAADATGHAEAREGYRQAGGHSPCLHWQRSRQRGRHHVLREVRERADCPRLV